MSDISDEDQISTHTPVKGVTILAVHNGQDHGYFNPHTRERCDAQNRHIYHPTHSISTHTPVKGVTR